LLEKEKKNTAEDGSEERHMNIELGKTLPTSHLET